jgi:hypothetical protein
LERVEKKQKKKYSQQKLPVNQPEPSVPRQSPAQELTNFKTSKLTDLAKGIVGKRKSNSDGNFGAVLKKPKVSDLSTFEEDDPEDKEIARLEKLLGVKKDGGEELFYLSVYAVFLNFVFVIQRKRLKYQQN